MSGDNANFNVTANGDWSHQSVASMLRHDHYSIDELAALLDMNADHLRQIVHNGDLKAFLIDHRIVSIRREDVLNWLRARAQTAS